MVLKLEAPLNIRSTVARREPHVYSENAIFVDAFTEISLPEVSDSLFWRSYAVNYWLRRRGKWKIELRVFKN